MNCETCGVEMVERQVTADAPYQYKLSGMKNLFLVGISICRCPNCGEEYPVIPKLGELHRVISKTIIGKGAPLAGEEVRFLRKNAGFSSARFSALIGVGQTHLSKVENGLKHLGISADKMVRIMAEAASDTERMREILLKHADKKIEKDLSKKVSERKVFELGNDRWQQVDLAA